MSVTHWGNIGDSIGVILGILLGLYWGYIGIMEKKMETTTKGYMSYSLNS